MIVLNENEWAKERIDTKDLGKKPSETLRHVARYYLDCGYSTQETRSKLDVFLLQCDPLASLPKWSDMLDFAVKRASKFNSIKIDSIGITKNEMDTIDSLNGKLLRRLAFTLLCLSKYWSVVNENNDGWVNNKDSEIMAMANINTSLRRQASLYHTLWELGMIQFSKKVDNTNVKVLFSSDGDVVFNVRDFRNLGYQYLMYHGEPYFECENCGITTKLSDPSNKRRQKYCTECSGKIHIKQKMDSIMRHRENIRFQNVDN